MKNTVKFNGFSNNKMFMNKHYTEYFKTLKKLRKELDD